MRILYRSNPSTLLKRLGGWVKKITAVYAATFTLTLIIVLAGAGVLNHFSYAQYLPRVPKSNPSVMEIVSPVNVAEADEDERTKAIVEGWKAKEIKKKQDTILDSLENAESGIYKELGFESPDALITWDPGRTDRGARIPSFGRFQWKIATFQMYYTKRHGIKLSQLEAIAKAQNATEARELARYVAFELNKGPDEWTNSFAKRNLQPKVVEAREMFKGE